MNGMVEDDLDLWQAGQIEDLDVAAECVVFVY